MQLVDEGGIGHDKLLAARNQLLGMASQNKSLVGVRPNALDDAPQLKVNVDGTRRARSASTCRPSIAPSRPHGVVPM